MLSDAAALASQFPPRPIAPDPASYGAATVAALNTASRAAATAGLHLGAENLARGQDVLASVVADLVTRAEIAASRALPDNNTLAALIWADMVELLGDAGLSTTVYCSKSGRDLGEIDPRPWLDHLRAIERLGASRAADEALERLFAAVVAQMGHTVAPPFLVTSVDALAMLRELHPADYVVQSLRLLLPTVPRVGPGAQSLALAQRAAMLGQLRRDAENLPRAALEYVAECLTLFLGHVRPGTYPIRHDALQFYALESWSGVLASSAAASHLCNRLVLTLWQLVQSRRLIPTKGLSIEDMRALRVHWHGLPEYRGQKVRRGAIVAALVRGQNKSGARAEKSGLGAENWADFDLAAALDLQSALRITGRKIPLQVGTTREHEALLRRRDTIRQAALELTQEDAPDTPTMDISLDLSMIAASGLIDGGDLEDDALSGGLFDETDVDSMFDLLFDAAPDDESDGETDDPELAQLLAMADDDESDGDTGLTLSFAEPAPRHVPVSLSQSVSDIKAAALERAIAGARPVGKLPPNRR